MSGGQIQIVFVGGLSGSGKTTAMGALEDLSFYCVDNLPAQLVPQFVDLCTKATPAIDKIALAVDSREAQFLRLFPRVVEELRAAGAQVKGIFLDCSDEVLVQRYSETRRVHPLSPDGSVENGIRRERSLLAELATLASAEIDTSELNVHELKERVIQMIEGRTRETVVNILSFGYRYGTPSSAELMFDLRFLPNPYFDDTLRQGNGMDPAVAEYVLKSSLGHDLFKRLIDFVEFLLPHYDGEGKAYATIGLGCTGGRHRSVAVAEALAVHLREGGREVNVKHRDVERER